MQRELASLRAALQDCRTQGQELQATVQSLQERLAAACKDFSTSSKPPSSDIVKPPCPPFRRRPATPEAAGQPSSSKTWWLLSRFGWMIVPKSR